MFTMHGDANNITNSKNAHGMLVKSIIILLIHRINPNVCVEIMPIRANEMRRALGGIIYTPLSRIATTFITILPENDRNAA